MVYVSILSHLIKNTVRAVGQLFSDDPLVVGWILFGFLAQCMFGGRMVIQWITSEKKKRSVVPPAFWFLSLIGGLMLLSYAIWREDIVIIIGQAFGTFVYARNIWLIYFSGKTKQQQKNNIEAVYSFQQLSDRDELIAPHLRISIARVGAELISIRALKAGATIPLLWNDGEPTPTHNGWKRHAPFLFPIVGGLVNKKSVMTDGTRIELNNHGFARDTEFQLYGAGATDVSVWAEYGINERMINDCVYPWKHEFIVRYELSRYGANTLLTVTMTVRNTDNTDMYYQLGWHPGLKSPVTEKGTKSNVQLLLPHGQYTQYEMDNNSFMTGSSIEKTLGGVFPVTEEELGMTYTFDMTHIKNRTVKLYDPAAKITSVIEFNDMPHLGIWSTPNAPFICIEPWQGCDDHSAQEPFDKKFGIMKLAPGACDERSVHFYVE